MEINQFDSSHLHDEIINSKKKFPVGYIIGGVLLIAIGFAILFIKEEKRKEIKKAS